LTNTAIGAPRVSRSSGRDRQPLTTHGFKARITLADWALIVPAFMK
jgi:hypothetical protein